MNDKKVHTISKIRGIFVDCDGVLTDGTSYYGINGKCFKRFSSHDGRGIQLARSAGIPIAVITEDKAGLAIVKSRCSDLGISVYCAANGEDKLRIAHEIISRWGCSLQECVFVADDVNDLPLLKLIGIPIAVANAVSEVRTFVENHNSYITLSRGGEGAVREVIEWLLRQGRI